MSVFEIILFIVAILISIGWGYGVRTYVHSGQGVSHGTANTTMLFVISIIVVLIAALSPYHLLWMFPLSWLIGTLSHLVFPFSLLSIPGHLFVSLCCIGLDPVEVQRNIDSIEKARQLDSDQNNNPPQFLNNLPLDFHLFPSYISTRND